MITQNGFSAAIGKILKNHFGDSADKILENSQLLQYIDIKTRSANKGAKARGSFANLYALYVIIEDYLSKEFNKNSGYSKYEGAEFSRLFKRQRELPFGAKLQNHALNNRVNSEFQKFFPNIEYVPILRNLETNKYWINENLLKVKTEHNITNIAEVVIEIIDVYSKTRKDAFEQFILSCTKLQEVQTKDSQEVEKFILDLLAPNVDARLFEIVSYAILKYFYHDQKIYWGFEKSKLNEENLKLYKTGRTNANDGGIDFVMRPLGRFFQVTETVDVKKYFLDIEKIQRYPITFVVKSTDSKESILKSMRGNADKIYSINAIVEKYMSCIEDIINIESLKTCFKDAIKQGYLKGILDEIILQSKVEFNYGDDSNCGDSMLLEMI
jgi:hypothetical protein